MSGTAGSNRFFANRGAQVRIRIFLVLAVLFIAAERVAAEAPASNTLVRAGRLLDPRTRNVISPAAVLIENGKIKEVGPPSKVQTRTPANVKTIDLGNATLLPGLIHSHTHLFLDIIVPPELEQQRHSNGLFPQAMLLAIIESPSKRVLMRAQSARDDFETGFTTGLNPGPPSLHSDTHPRDRTPVDP